eukprot:scaffold305167_cov22-Tisochrysis_lutea.AAC.1
MVGGDTGLWPDTIYNGKDEDVYVEFESAVHPELYLGHHTGITQGKRQHPQGGKLLNDYGGGNCLQEKRQGVETVSRKKDRQKSPKGPARTSFERAVTEFYFYFRPPVRT